LPESTLDVLRGFPLTEEQAREIFARGEEAVVFVLLELSKRLAEQKGKTAAECDLQRLAGAQRLDEIFSGVRGILVGRLSRVGCCLGCRLGGGRRLGSQRVLPPTRTC